MKVKCAHGIDFYMGGRENDTKKISVSDITISLVGEFMEVLPRVEDERT